MKSSENLSLRAVPSRRWPIWLPVLLLFGLVVRSARPRRLQPQSPREELRPPAPSPAAAHGPSPAAALVPTPAATQDAGPGSAQSSGSPGKELTGKLLQYIEQVEQSDRDLLSHVKALETSLLGILGESRSAVRANEGHDLSADSMDGTDIQAYAPVDEGTDCAESIGWLAVLPATEVEEEDPPSCPDAEERKFLAWISASDQLMEEHKDASGWEEPAGVMQRVLDRLSPLAFRTSTAEHAGVR